MRTYILVCARGHMHKSEDNLSKKKPMVCGEGGCANVLVWSYSQTKKIPMEVVK